MKRIIKERKINGKFKFCFICIIIYIWYHIINSVNYFYLLDCPVKDVLPFYKDLMIGHIKIFNVDLYIVYLLFIYVVFTALCYLLYFIQVLFFKLAIYLKYQSAKILFHKQR